ncbi:MAG: hypothetical protein JW816_00900 [Candidatus Buchananbacteria bacterium]|nr:hypothetical protein [Candidatus Buchananbacteria bacterium]
MKNFLVYFLIIACSFSFLPLSVAGQMTSGNYQIDADVFSTGGNDTSSSANFKLLDSLGEPVVYSATSTSETYGTKAGFREMYPDQFLTLDLGSGSIDFGTLSTSETKTASHTLTIDSNAINGLSVTVSGSTLTAGANQIAAIGATAAAAQVGTEQFGINLKSNTTPAVGAEPVGDSPQAEPNGQYATADQFAFQSGDTIISATSDIAKTTTTVSYIANISSSTAAGSYSTTLTYAATANF